MHAASQSSSACSVLCRMQNLVQISWVFYGKSYVDLRWHQWGALDIKRNNIELICPLAQVHAFEKGLQHVEYISRYICICFSAWGMGYCTWGRLLKWMVIAGDKHAEHFVYNVARNQLNYGTQSVGQDQRRNRCQDNWAANCVARQMPKRNGKYGWLRRWLTASLFDCRPDW